MINHLGMTNVGPAPEMELMFGSRLNLITGDNGLGKSFLLDISWWAMTRQWPGALNPKLTSGKVALPTNKKRKAEIDFSFSALTTTKNYTSTFEPRIQSWSVPRGRPANPGLVFYALSDGSFAVWDPARNYWKSKEGNDRPSAYVFSPKEVWDGLQTEEGTWLCNGLIRDWAGWQKEKGRAFANLMSVLDGLSPSASERLEPGELTRISLDDARDMPTLKMPYGQEVAVVHASSGIRRIISLAYFLVWCWEEHLKAVELLGEEPVRTTVFLIDEVEAHLHPKWQRLVIPALMNVINRLTDLPDFQDTGKNHDIIIKPGVTYENGTALVSYDVRTAKPDRPVTPSDVQLIAVTHSPLIMASVETWFDGNLDAWFDLDLVDNNVELTRRQFVRQGDILHWLTSEAFDMKSGYSAEAEQVLEEAAQALSDEHFGKADALALEERLRSVLSDLDPFWMRWKFVGEKKGWLL